MYYDSNKESYHLPISSVSVQGNKPYSVQQFSLSISILVSALVFIVANHSQTDGCLFLLSLSFSFVHLSWTLISHCTCLYTFAHQHSCAKLEASNPSHSHFAQYLSQFHIPTAVTISYFLKWMTKVWLRYDFLTIEVQYISHK